MANFRLEFTESFRVIIKAGSEDEIRKCAFAMSSEDIRGLDNPAGWDVGIWETDEEPGWGVRNGEFVHIEHMPSDAKPDEARHELKQQAGEAM